MNNNNLSDRMKVYESAASFSLTRRLPVIIRVDGKAFHTYTKNLERPWDEGMVDTMGKTACALVENIQGCKIAYVQSDEISLLLTDYNKINTSAWFDKKVQKMVSVSASMATAFFNKFANQYGIDVGLSHSLKMAFFDSRVFTIPESEITNYFIWRQQDATRNSVSMLAQSKFSHRELQGKSSDQMQEMLFQHHGINWNDTPTHLKRGWCSYKESFSFQSRHPISGCEERTTRTRVVEDREVPIFTQDRDFVLR